MIAVPGSAEAEEEPMETAIGIVLIVIATIEILGIVRVVSANLNVGR